MKRITSILICIILIISLSQFCFAVNIPNRFDIDDDGKVTYGEKEYVYTRDTYNAVSDLYSKIENIESDISGILTDTDHIWEEVLYTQDQISQLTTAFVIFAIVILIALASVIVQNILLNQKINNINTSPLHEKTISNLQTEQQSEDTSEPENIQQPSDDIKNEDTEQESFTELESVEAPEENEVEKKPHKKKLKKVYVKRESAPLFFHHLLLYVSIPLGILGTLSNLFNNKLIGMSAEDLISYTNGWATYTTATEIIKRSEIYQTVLILGSVLWIVLCICFIVGSARWKPMGWISINIMCIYRVFFNLLLVILVEAMFSPYPFFYKTLSTGSMWGEVIAFTIWSILVYIYYRKRKPLFYPELIDKIPEECIYQTEEEIKFEEPLKENSHEL